MNKEQIRLKEILTIIKNHELLKNKSPQNIRTMIEDLGPTFIKMGQILSSRSDLISQNYIDELKKLRCSVKPMEYEEIKTILNKEYSNVEEIFSSIEKEPIGSASIAQTHLGKLTTGETIAIKIQRPDIKEKMKLDAKLLKKAISILHLEKLSGNIADLKGMIDEMYTSAKEEMDFLIEANHAEIFKKNNADVQYLKPLKVYKEFSTTNVLVMEYIDGIFINEKDKLKSLGYDLKEISIKLADNYIKQAIDDGFFHADPHSDNIKIQDGKIVYIDFGMMGHLSTTNKKLLNECLIAIIKNDTSEIAHILGVMNTNNNAIDYMKLKIDINKILEKNKTTEIININIKDFFSDMLELLKTNQITLPRDIIMLIRGIIVIEGVLEEINPQINFITVLKNRIRHEDIINKNKVEEAVIKGIKSSKDLITIPSETLEFLKGINSGELKFNIEMTDSKNQINNFANLFHQAIIALLDISFIIGISIMTMLNPNNLPFIFYIYILLAIICTSWLFIKIFISNIKNN